MTKIGGRILKSAQGADVLVFVVDSAEPPFTLGIADHSQTGFCKYAGW